MWRGPCPFGVEPTGGFTLARLEEALVAQDGNSFAGRLLSIEIGISNRSQSRAWLRRHAGAFRPGPVGVWVVTESRGFARAAIRCLTEALNAKDPYTRGHSRRVGDYAAAIAQELGLSRGHVEAVRLGGQLHDVGKIGTPDELLMKPGPLTADEHRVIQQHCVVGEQILRPLFAAWPVVLAVVRWHHERLDGSGFPDGLTHQDIPLVARIVSVADALDAMTTTRVYRDPLPLGQALRELRHGAGTQFDGRCVRAFILLLARRARQRALVYFRGPRLWVYVLILAATPRSGPYAIGLMVRPGPGPPIRGSPKERTLDR